MVRRATITAVLLVLAAPATPALAGGPCGERQGARGDERAEPRFTGKLRGAGRRCPARRVDGRLSDWRGRPTNTSGQGVTSRGEAIFTDWLYDDHGPNLDGLPGRTQYRASLAPVLGDYRYPADHDRYGLNAADLREIRVAADRRGLHFLIRLQTMKARDAAIVSIALDAGGGARDWPDGAGLRAGGADRFVTTWGSGARLTRRDGTTRPVRHATNVRANAIELFVPYRALGPLSRRPRLWVASGLNDGGRFRRIAAGETAAFNVAPRAERQLRFGSNWNEQEQSAALASGDVSRFGARFDVRRLRRGRSDARTPLAPGFYNRIFRSRKNYGDGAVPSSSAPGADLGGSPEPKFLSRWQPYGIYIPDGWDPSRAAPLTLNGHSLDSNMNQYRNVSPNLYRQIGDDRGSIVLTPLARGADTWYLRSGLVDVMEAWRDVRRNFEVDNERTAIMGYSMGGYMTYRLGLLMPDRFSRASVYVGPPAYQYWAYPGPILPGDPAWTVPGNTNRIVENAHNLPYEIVHGNLDELVPVSGVQHQADTFAAAGNDYRFFRHSADDHLSFIANDDWSRTRDWLGTETRVKNPVSVEYRRYPSMDLPEDGFVFDRAYWLSGIEVRSAPSPESSGLVRATTYGLGGSRKRAEPQPPVPVPGPVTPGVLTQQRQLAGEPIARRNGFEASLENVGGAAFDVRRMGLDPAEPLTLRVTSDGEADVTLMGDFGTVSAGSLPVAAVPGRVVITFPAGTTEVTVRPR